MYHLRLAVAVITAAALLCVGMAGLGSTLAHADEVHVGTPILIESNIGQDTLGVQGGPTYVVHAPRVLRPFGGYTATPNVSKRMRPHTCATFRYRDVIRSSDVAITTTSGVQLAQVIHEADAPHTFHDVVNGSRMQRVAGTFDGRTACNRTGRTMWAHLWYEVTD